VTYEEFASSRLPALLRYAAVLTGDPHEAADLVQETMIRAHLKWRQVSAATAPERYVKKMLTNAFVDWRRGSWLRRVVLRGEPARTAPAGADRTPMVPDHAVGSAERAQMWGWLAQLPRRQRAALVLRYYEDLTDGEIAELLGCAVGTVRAHISRALATLRADVVPASYGGGFHDRG
jgi:RNA polymerase sigma-70 factor (sigma-E family)